MGEIQGFLWASIVMIMVLISITALIFLGINTFNIFGGSNTLEDALKEGDYGAFVRLDSKFNPCSSKLNVTNSDDTTKTVSVAYTTAANDTCSGIVLEGDTSKIKTTDDLTATFYNEEADRYIVTYHFYYKAFITNNVTFAERSITLKY